MAEDRILQNDMIFERQIFRPNIDLFLNDRTHLCLIPRKIIMNYALKVVVFHLEYIVKAALHQRTLWRISSIEHPVKQTDSLEYTLIGTTGLKYHFLIHRVKGLRNDILNIILVRMRNAVKRVLFLVITVIARNEEVAPLISLIFIVGS